MESRKYGRYDTVLFNPFAYDAFHAWMSAHGLEEAHVLEPFAGCNSLIRHLQALGYTKSYTSYDMHPRDPEVRRRDTLLSYPKGFSVCISNPPWLYRSSAQRLRLPFLESKYDDLYKHCTDLCLQHSPFVALLLPASFLSSGLFRHRLEALIFIQRPLFEHTESPVCLALFGKETSKRTLIYADNDCLGTLSALAKHLPAKGRCQSIRFNVPNGPLGFVGIDNHHSASIRFCKGEELAHHAIKHSSRSLTRIGGVPKVNKALLERLNARIDTLRRDTHDVFLTTFKGLRKDGKYRRRMDYGLAHRILNDCLSCR